MLLFATAISVPLALGFFGDWHPAFDSLAHFRAHLAVSMAVVVLPLLFSRFRLPAATALAFALAAFSTTSNALAIAGMGPVQAGFDPKADDRAIYRLLQMNLRFDNDTPEKVLSLIGRTRPDVITLNEVSNAWKGKLDLLASAYPHRIVCPFPNRVFGVAILSRRPFAAGTEPQCYSRGALAIATVDFGGDAVDVAAIHLAWPWPFEQQWQIGTMAEPLGRLGETAIMAGDCNAVPWSAAVRRVAELGGLRPIPSIGPTWLYIKLPRVPALRGTGDRPGVQQGQGAHPLRYAAGKHRLRPSAGDGGVLAAAERQEPCGRARDGDRRSCERRSAA